MTSRTLAAIALSLLVLLVGSAVAEQAPEQSQQRRHHKQRPTPGPVRHDTKFAKVPGSQLQIRAIEYDGSTNGTLKVQLKNTSKAAQSFSATGLYFVPDGDPDSAPQRLGAVGPMQLAAGGSPKEMSKIEVAPGATVEVALDVFCIDSHRASPSPANVFSVGTKRLPKELAQTIEKRADSMVHAAAAEGAPAPRPAAKQKIQEEVWRTRDAKWQPLEGEGTQEAAK
ncbi:MAG: hypothetical protein H0T42_03040 [Deltaproteobacteria bacterium]|nr:hypothetical protein [Deltaproteobacteria bacterium]